MTTQSTSTDPRSVPSHVDFYFDPTCPWTFRASLWLRQVREVRPIEITWKFLSLLEINRPSGTQRETHHHSYATFPLLLMARDRFGNEAVDRLYLALGRARHERGESLGDPAVVERALSEAGLDPAWRTEAADRPDLEQRILAEHRDAVERLHAIAVPSVSIEGDRAFFGPVLTDVPQGEDAGQFWDHLSWLARRNDFFEYMKSRD